MKVFVTWKCKKADKNKEQITYPFLDNAKQSTTNIQGYFLSDISHN